ncbi:MAG: right-handed parallel beta-helix repeat-containing protein, partial [Planctomycetales bacterium]|nr:right-handed parallel beta-helix repeat-containing protein [Planctomycetales bacterium]
AATYYVDFAYGGIAYNGLSPSPAGVDGPFPTIEHAITVAESNGDSGDTIFVRAVGTYTQPLTITEDGIKLIGYEDSVNATTGWSDLDDGRGVPANYNEMRGLVNGMPVMHEQPEINLGDRTAGKAIDIKGDNVVVRNFTIHDCFYGINSGATTNLTVENINGYSFGPLIVKDWGRGINLSTVTQSTVKNCRILNAGGYGVSLTEFSTGTTIVDTEAYSDEGDPGQGEGDGCDYFFLIAHTSSATISNCRAERNDGGDGVFQEHGGHGFVLEGTDPNKNCHSNTITDSTAIQVRQAVWLLGQNSAYNTVKKFYATRGDLNDNVGGSIYIGNGAHSNTVRRTFVQNARGGVTFSYDVNQTGSDLYSGFGNIIENCIFERCENAVLFNPHNGDHAKLAKDNTFRNCTFTGRVTPTQYVVKPDGTYEDSRGLFYAHRNNENTAFVNCIFSDFTVKEFKNCVLCSGKPYYQVDASFEHCCLFQCGDGNTATDEGFPESQSAMDADIHYVDSVFALSDPILNTITYMPTSVAIDEGTAFVPETEDYDGSPRWLGIGNPVDIGAQEKQGSGGAWSQ